jgi:esterase/lipase superfamily enzyme
MKNIIAICLLSLFLASCKSSSQIRQQNLQRIWGEYFKSDFNQTEILDVLVVTNRNAINDSFGCDDKSFAVTGDNQLKFGLCKISVPKNHANGEIPFSEDSRKSSNDYFKILDGQPLSEKDLIKSLKQSKYPVLIFVHGFNVKYQEAVLRASGLAYDLKYQGPIILFSWPSGSKEGIVESALLNRTYYNNLVSAHNSVAIFKNFLLKLKENNVEINLMVHSMGHEVVLPALAQIDQESPSRSNKPFVNHLILNAPDFEVSEFKKISKNLQATSANITLYCSSNDKAMIASKTFNKSDRLGACSFSEGFDMINVGLIDDRTFSLGHGYYSSREIITDIFQTLIGITPDKRLFVIKGEPNSNEKYFLRR